jgi:Transposase DDE domain
MPVKPKCCPNVPWRKVPRDVHEEARDQARALMDTPEFERSRDERKRVEMRFAHLKTHHRFDRMRLRGLSRLQLPLPGPPFRFNPHGRV